MRTPLSSGLAAASLGLLVAGLAFRSWQVVLLALPPVIVLALGSLFPPARPRLVAVRTLSRDRAEVGPRGDRGRPPARIRNRPGDEPRGRFPGARRHDAADLHGAVARER